MTIREVVVDDRRRTSLAKVGRKEDERYLVEEFPDGTMVWTPAVTISAVELAALRNPELVASFDRARTPEEPVNLRSRGSFRKYAEEEDKCSIELSPTAQRAFVQAAAAASKKGVTP